MSSVDPNYSESLNDWSTWFESSVDPDRSEDLSD